MNQAFHECPKYYSSSQSAQIVSMFLVGYLTTMSVYQDYMVSGGRKTDTLLRTLKEAMMIPSRCYHGINRVQIQGQFKEA
jgi:hypothetical protein